MFDGQFIDGILLTSVNFTDEAARKGRQCDNRRKYRKISTEVLIE